MRKLWFFGVFLLSCGGQKHREAGLVFKNWYVVTPVVQGGGTVAYGEIINESTTPKLLKSADFSCATGTALHETITTGDRVTMAALPETTLGAGETIAFEPGHKHVMLSGIKNAGDKICTAGFVFDTGKIGFPVQVRPREK